jgi:hypothetical protein
MKETKTNRCEHCGREDGIGIFTKGTRNSDLATDLLLFAVAILWPIVLVNGGL